MNDAKSQLELRIRELSREYAASLPEKLTELKAALGQASADDPAREGHMAVQRLAHTMAGGAGTFGLARISEVSSKIEAICLAAKNTDVALSPSQLTEIRTLARDLEILVGAALEAADMAREN